jgi:NADH dehydrogenase
VREGARVARIDEQGVIVRAEGRPDERIPARTVLWAAGVRASPLAETLGVPLDASGRVIVDDALRVPGFEEAFCLGDMAAQRNADGSVVPGVAPAALQGGRFVARQIAHQIHGGRGHLVFRYLSKGNLATIGRRRAVAEFGRLALSGFSAWALWLVVHLCFLVGFRNRYLVLYQWVWHYFTYQGGARLITGPRDVRFRWPAQPRRLAKSPASIRPTPVAAGGPP